MFSNPISMLGTVSHDHHRLRRQPLGQYFSKASVDRLEPLIKQKIDDLCQRFEKFRGTGKPIHVENAYMAMTTDIITDYCFGRSYGYMEHPEFSPAWYELWIHGNEFSLFAKQFPWFVSIAQQIPQSVLEAMKANVVGFLQFRDVCQSVQSKT